VDLVIDVYVEVVCLHYDLQPLDESLLHISCIELFLFFLNHAGIMIIAFFVIALFVCCLDVICPLGVSHVKHLLYYLPISIHIDNSS